MDTAKQNQLQDLLRLAKHLMNVIGIYLQSLKSPKPLPIKSTYSLGHESEKLTEAVQTGTGQLNSISIVPAIVVMDFQIMGSTVGSIVGEL